MDEKQTQDEIEAQAGEGSVGEFVLAWFYAIFSERSWHYAMTMCSAEYRGLMVEAWLGGEVEHRSTLTNCDTADPLWEQFCTDHLQAFDDQFGEIASHIAIGSRPRPLGIDIEVVNIIDYRTVGAPESLVFGQTTGRLVERVQEAFAKVIVRSDETGLHIAGLDFNPNYSQV